MCIFLDGKSAWYVDLKSGKGAAGNGQSPTIPDTVLTATLSDVFDIMTGN